MNWVAERLKEPSTWAGFGVVLGAVATAFPSVAYYAGGAAAVCGAIAGVVKEANTPG